MTLIDERGRLFGRFNLIDALAVVFVLVLIPVAYGAYRLFRVPPPTIVGVEPKAVPQSVQPVVQLNGTNFLPYLSAYVAPAGKPLPRYLNNRAQTEAVFFLQSPTTAMLQLPPLVPGVYDLYLYSDAKELTRLDNAITIEPAQPVVKRAVSGRTVARVRIRAMMPADIATFITAGDIDRYGSPTASGEPDATILNVTRQRVPNPTPGVNDSVIAVMDLRLPVSRSEKDLWSYKGQRIRVGESITFGTDRYVTQGLIVQAEFPEDVPWDTPQ